MVPSELAAPPEAAHVVERRHVVRAGGRHGSRILFLFAFAAYFAIGAYTTIHLHVVLGDAESRLTHAYDVFWNAPPKLAALGFVWPPLMSAVFLPFALVRPLATSLWALPLMTAIAGAGLLTTLERALRHVGMGAAARLAIVALFGINPMVAAYAANGMSEILAQWLLTLAVVAFVRWYSDRLSRQLVLVGVFMTLGTLVRYELALWLGVLLPAIGLMVADRKRSRLEFEASVVAVLAPVVYALAVWTVLNWSILGSPFAWLHEETTQTFVITRSMQRLNFGLVHVVWYVVRENALLFPLTFAVAGALMVHGSLKRNVMSWTLALALLLNVATTVAIAVATHTPHIYELRFNIRTMPLTIVGVAWLYRSSVSRTARSALVLATIAALALTIPLTWHTMKTFPVRLDEEQFTAAIATGRDQSHLVRGLDPVADRAMARYVVAHVHTPNAVLTDDSQTFGVILATGRPELFADRVDHGDAKWIQTAIHPYRKVRYLLFSWISQDQLGRLYPRADAGLSARGLRLVFQTRTSKLYAVVGPVH
jgi:hypothetical protein